jgi:hypothetical protein
LVAGGGAGGAGYNSSVSNSFQHGGQNTDYNGGQTGFWNCCDYTNDGSVAVDPYGGLGAGGVSDASYGGGGGGWYGGGGNYWSYSGGGSSYIFFGDEDSGSNKAGYYGSLPDERFSTKGGATKNGGEAMPDPVNTGQDMQGKVGDGYAKISKPGVAYGSVTVGGKECVIQTWESNENALDEITCLTPPATAKTVDVVVSTAGGDAVLEDGYTYGTPTTLQGFASDPELCSSLPFYTNNSESSVEEDITDDNLLRLVDARNEQEQYYLVGKLADGHCWLLNNLKITPDEIANADPSLSDPDLDFELLDGISEPSADYDYDGWTPKYYDPGGSDDITLETFYGYQYNWCAMTGGTGCNDPGFMGGMEAQSTSYPTICPAGWVMPTGVMNDPWSWLSGEDGNRDYYNLNYSINSDNPWSNNLGFSSPFRGVNGSYWTNFVWSNYNDWSYMSNYGFIELNKEYSSIMFSNDSSYSGSSTPSSGRYIRCRI